MITAIRRQDPSLILEDALFDICPLAGNLDGSVYGFSAAQHGGHGVEPKFLSSISDH